jgi:hypothetical protein
MKNLMDPLQARIHQVSQSPWQGLYSDYRRLHSPVVGCDLREISAQTHQRQKSPFAVRKLQAPPTNSADEQSDHDYDKPEQRTKYGRTINKPEHFSSIQTTGSGTRNLPEQRCFSRNE